MEPFDLFSKYFWLAFIIVSGINFVIFRKRAEKHIKANPELAEGYASLFRGYLFWTNIPWVVMGVGCTIGGVPTVWDYFRPRDGNPYVLAWFGSVFFLWIMGTFWLFFRDGAEELARHPGLIQFHLGFKSGDVTSPVLIKVFWVLCLAGGILAVVTMWRMDIPTPTFR